MKTNPRHLLLRPGGRLNAREFALGIAMFVIVAIAAVALMRALNPSTAAGFWVGLVMVILFPYMLYSVWGQRLHDMGRTVWPLTGMLFLLLLVVLGLLTLNGLGDVVYAVTEVTPEQAKDEAYMRALIAPFEAQMQTTRVPIGIIGAIAFGALTLWLLIARGEPHANRYGEPV